MRRCEIAAAVVSRWVRNYKVSGSAAFDMAKRNNIGEDRSAQFRQVEQENKQLKIFLGGKISGSPFKGLRIKEKHGSVGVVLPEEYYEGMRE